MSQKQDMLDPALRSLDLTRFCFDAFSRPHRSMNDVIQVR